MTYKITPENQKSIFEVEIWKKDDSTFKIIKNWRWGSVTVEEEPDLSNYDPDIGINVNEECYVVDCDLTDAEIDFEFSPDIDDELRMQLQKEWLENMDDGLTEMGWSEYQTECWLFGGLVIQRLEQETL